MTEEAKATEVVEAEQVDAVPEVKTKSARVAVVQQVEDESSDEEREEEGEPEVADEEILADLPDDIEEISLNHSRIKTVSKLNLQRFTQLRRLYLRQNHISSLDPEAFRPLTLLEELELYDNGLKSIGDALDECAKLQSLDVSYNLFRRIPENLDKFLELQKVYFVQNKISQISGLEPVGKSLVYLELGGNRIRQIEGLGSLENLRDLWLGKNKITKLEGLSNLKKLRTLSIQSNRITKMEGLEGLENLEELYLSHNGIEKIEGLEKNTKLRVLDIAANFVPELENIAHLTQLEDLWMNTNKITSLQSLETQLKHIASLDTVYLEQNPVQEKEGVHYRRKIILALPQISQLDATYVKQS